VIDFVASGKLDLSNFITERFPLEEVNPVRNSSGALNPAGIIVTSNPAAEQRGTISNGVNKGLYHLHKKVGNPTRLA